jgi:hypothetical protein
MKEYLTKFMIANRNPDDEFIKKAQDLFLNVCKITVNKLGAKPFHVRAGINVSVLDSVLVAIAKNLNRIPTKIKQNFKKLLKDKSYFKSISGATTDVEVVKNRFKLAQEYLF